VPEPHLSAWRALLNAHASVVGGIEQALANAGLPPLAWYDVLWAVRRAPGRHVRMAELADGLTLSRGGVTKLVDRLEMLRRMWPVYARILRETFVDTLSNEEAAVISAGLARAKDAAVALPAQP